MRGSCAAGDSRNDIMTIPSLGIEKTIQQIALVVQKINKRNLDGCGTYVNCHTIIACASREGQGAMAKGGFLNIYARISGEPGLTSQAITGLIVEYFYLYIVFSESCPSALTLHSRRSLSRRMAR